MSAERLVLLVVYDGVQLLDVVGPAEVFATANHLLGGGAYRLLVASPRGGGVRSDSGLTLGADAALAEVDAVPDTVVVAGGLGAHDASLDETLRAAVRAAAGQARRLCSVCTGAFVLAAAGLLEGRAATTHWAVCAELARRHPGVRVEPDRIFVRDGHVYTSAGVTAGIDLALALVEADHGADLARTVARWLVMFLQRPGGQSQFSARLDPAVPGGSPLRPVLDAIIAEPAADHRLPQLAERAALSERHLGRLFAEHIGTTPAKFVERVRVEAARELLESTSLPVETVAARSGFGSDETLRRAFVRVLGVGPADYRERFRTAPDFDVLPRQARTKEVV